MIVSRGSEACTCFFTQLDLEFYTRLLVVEMTCHNYKICIAENKLCLRVCTFQYNRVVHHDQKARHLIVRTEQDGGVSWQMQRALRYHLVKRGAHRCIILCVLYYNCIRIPHRCGRLYFVLLHVVRAPSSPLRIECATQEKAETDVVHTSFLSCTQQVVICRLAGNTYKAISGYRICAHQD